MSPCSSELSWPPPAPHFLPHTSGVYSEAYGKWDFQSDWTEAWGRDLSPFGVQGKRG